MKKKTQLQHLIRRTRAFRNLISVDYTNVPQMLKQAKLNFPIETRDLYYKAGADTPYQVLPTNTAVINSRTKELLGVAGKGYKIADNTFVGCLAHDIAQELGSKITYAGRLRSGNFAPGSRICFQALLGTEQVADDVLVKQLIITSSHDMSMSITFYLGLLKIICANGLVAYDKKFNNLIKVKHTANYKESIKEARKKLLTANSTYNTLKHNLEVMARTKFSKREGRKAAYNLGSQMYPPAISKTHPEKGWSTTTKAENKRKRLVELYDAEEVDHSVYRVYQAATYFIDHDRAISYNKDYDDGSEYFNNIITGSGNELKKKAYTICLGMAV